MPAGVKTKSIRAGPRSTVYVWGDAARAEQEVAGARRDRLLPDGERELALEDPEALVLGVVDVQRDLDALGSEDLDERQVPVGLLARDLDRGQLSRPPVGLALAGGHSQRRPGLQVVHSHSPLLVGWVGCG